MRAGVLVVHQRRVLRHLRHVGQHQPVTAQRADRQIDAGGRSDDARQRSGGDHGAARRDRAEIRLHADQLVTCHVEPGRTAAGDHGSARAGEQPQREQLRVHDAVVRPVPDLPHLGRQPREAATRLVAVQELDAVAPSDRVVRRRLELGGGALLRHRRHHAAVGDAGRVVARLARVAGEVAHRRERLARQHELVRVVVLQTIGTGGDRGRRAGEHGPRLEHQRLDARAPGRVGGGGADHAAADDDEFGGGRQGVRMGDGARRHASTIARPMTPLTLDYLLTLRIWRDGEVVDPASAVVSVWDHGLLYGDGVFEGIRLRSGRLYRPYDHLNRLHGSARAVALEIPYDDDTLLTAVADTARGQRHRRGARAHRRLARRRPARASTRRAARSRPRWCWSTRSRRCSGRIP